MFYNFLITSHHLYQKTLIFYFIYISIFNLTFLTYPLILGIIKTDGLIVLSKYPIKYLELVFVSINFEKTILSTLPSQIIIGFFCRIKPFFCYFSPANSQHYYTMEGFLWLFFELTDISIFPKKSYTSSFYLHEELI